MEQNLTKIIGKDLIYIDVSPTCNGRGVFAKCDISPERIIEYCPVIEISAEHVPKLMMTNAVDYYFMWGDNLSAGAIALGYGSLYNHSYHSNATFCRKLKDKTIEIKAIRNIKKGEEITINYNGDPDDTTPLSEHYNIPDELHQDL
jgi:SET domain-containing protein